MPSEEIRKRHLQLMDECIQDAKHLAIKHGINQEDVVAALAAALFRERVKTIKELGKYNEAYRQDLDLQR